MKYNIPDEYLYQALQLSEYMRDQRDKEITILVAHLEAGLRFPFYPFFRWFIKNFWIYPEQLVPNRWRYLVAYIWLCHKNKLNIWANALRTLTKMS